MEKRSKFFRSRRQHREGAEGAARRRAVALNRMIGEDPNYLDAPLKVLLTTGGDWSQLSS